MDKDLQRRLGPSDAGPILLDAPRPAFSVYVRVVEGVELESTFWIEKGRALEPVLRRQAERDLGASITKPESLVFGDRPWLRASPDGLFDNVGIEFKSHGNHVRSQYGEQGTDEVPESEILQCQAYMEIFGMQRWHLAVNFGDSGTLSYFLIERNQELGGMILQKLEAFWRERIEPRDPPPLPPALLSKQLAKRWQTHSLDRVVATPELDHDMTLLRRLKDTEKQSKLIRVELENRIKAAIGDNGYLDGEELSCAWKQRSASSKTDWKAAFTELSNAIDLVQSVKPGWDIDTDSIKTAHTKRVEGSRTLYGPTRRRK